MSRHVKACAVVKCRRPRFGRFPYCSKHANRDAQDSDSSSDDSVATFRSPSIDERRSLGATPTLMERRSPGGSPNINSRRQVPSLVGDATMLSPSTERPDGKRTTLETDSPLTPNSELLHGVMLARGGRRKKSVNFPDEITSGLSEHVGEYSRSPHTRRSDSSSSTLPGRDGVSVTSSASIRSASTATVFGETQELTLEDEEPEELLRKQWEKERQHALKKGVILSRKGKRLSEYKPFSSVNRWKCVRIFCSSTFEDFHDERDYLGRHVFEEMREACQHMRVRLIDIDLRWGVPKKTEAEDTLRTCLGELDRCIDENKHAFFLAMVGERYGWVPEAKHVPADVEATYGWKPYRSVTEMEIQHGAFRDNNPNAIFCLRTCSSPLEKKIFYRWAVESDKERPIRFLASLKSRIKETFGPEGRVFEYSRRVNPVRHRVNKQTLEEWQNDRESPEEVEKELVGMMAFVKEKFMENIRRDHFVPELLCRSVSSQGLGMVLLENARAISIAQIQEAVGSRMSLGTSRQKLLFEIDDFVHSSAHRHWAGDERILVLRGIEGCGKTTIMSHAAHFVLLEKMPRDFIVTHFVGMGQPDQDDLRGLLTRLVSELEFGLSEESDVQTEWGDASMSRRRTVNQSSPLTATNAAELTTAQMATRFSELLQDLADAKHRSRRLSTDSGASNSPSNESGQIVILIDSVDRLDIADFAQTYWWLPRMPAGCKMIITVSERGELKNREDVACIDIPPLDEAESLHFIRQYFMDFNKQVEYADRKLLRAKEPGFLNPMWLNMMCGEIRVVSKDFTLQSDIELIPRTLGDLMAYIFKRLFHEPFVGRTVAGFACLISCARRGLLENEVEKILREHGYLTSRDNQSPVGKDGDTSQYIFKRAMRMLNPFLRKGSEITEFFLTFRHQSFNRAVKKYLSRAVESDDIISVASAVEWHEWLADHFEAMGVKQGTGILNRSSIGSRVSHGSTSSELITSTQQHIEGNLNPDSHQLDLSSDYGRKALELPYHLNVTLEARHEDPDLVDSLSELTRRMLSCLTDYDNFTVLCVPERMLELAGYWRKVGHHLAGQLYQQMLLRMESELPHVGPLTIPSTMSLMLKKETHTAALRRMSRSGTKKIITENISSIYDIEFDKRRQIGKSTHLEMAERRVRVGNLLHTLGLYRDSSLFCDRAIDLCEKALESSINVLAESGSDSECDETNNPLAPVEMTKLKEKCVETHLLQAKNYYLNREIDSAESQLEHAGALYRDLDKWDAGYSMASGLRAQINVDKGNFDEATKILDEAMSAVKAWTSKSECVPLTLELNTLKAMVLEKQGRYREAITLCDQVSKQMSVTQGVDLSRAPVLTCKGCNYLKLDEKDKALACFVECVNLTVTALGRHHPDVASAKTYLAGAYKAMGDMAAAEREFLDALVIREATLPPNATDVVHLKNKLSELYNETGRVDMAMNLCKQTLESLGNDGRDSSGRAKTLVCLGSISINEGKWKDAKNYLQDGTEMLVRSPSEDITALPLARLHLASALSALREFDEAEEIAQDALEELKNVFKESNSLVVGAACLLSEIHTKMNNVAQAKGLLETILEQVDESFSDHPSDNESKTKIAMLLRSLAAAEAHDDNMQLAGNYYESAVKLYRDMIERTRRSSVMSGISEGTLSDELQHSVSPVLRTRNDLVQHSSCASLELTRNSSSPPVPPLSPKKLSAGVGHRRTYMLELAKTLEAYGDSKDQRDPGAGVEQWRNALEWRERIIGLDSQQHFLDARGMDTSVTGAEQPKDYELVGLARKLAQATEQTEDLDQAIGILGHVGAKEEIGRLVWLKARYLFTKVVSDIKEAVSKVEVAPTTTSPQATVSSSEEPLQEKNHEDGGSMTSSLEVIQNSPKLSQTMVEISDCIKSLEDSPSGAADSEDLDKFKLSVEDLKRGKSIDEINRNDSAVLRPTLADVKNSEGSYFQSVRALLSGSSMDISPGITQHQHQQQQQKASRRRSSVMELRAPRGHTLTRKRSSSHRAKSSSKNLFQL